MTDEIRPLARLFRGMADLIDRDHTSQSRYEAHHQGGRGRGGPCHRPGLVDGRLWRVDGADLLAAAYAFHAGLPRQAATAAHVQAMQQSGLGSAGGHQPQPPPVSPGRPGMGDPDDWPARPGSPARSVAPPLDPHRLPGPRLGELDPADAAKLWALVSELPGSQFIPRSQLIRLTGVLPADLAARLLRLLEGEGQSWSGRRRPGSAPRSTQRPGHSSPGRGRAGLAGGRRTGPGRREQLPGAAGLVERSRSAGPAPLAPRPDSNGWALANHGEARR